MELAEGIFYVRIYIVPLMQVGLWLVTSRDALSKGIDREGTSCLSLEEVSVVAGYSRIKYRELTPTPSRHFNKNSHALKARAE